MSHEYYCRFLRTQTGLVPIFFYGNRVDVTFFLEFAQQGAALAKMRKSLKVFEDKAPLRSDGVNFLFKPPVPLADMSSHGYFCDPLDISMIRKMYLDLYCKDAAPMTGIEGESFRAACNFAVVAVTANQVDIVAKSFDAFCEKASALDEQQNRTLKRQRNDVHRAAKKIAEDKADDDGAARRELK